MKNDIKTWMIGIFLAILGALGYNSGMLGAITSPATNYDYMELSQGLRIPAGPSVSTSLRGSSIQGVFHGTCNLTQAIVGSHSATTSKQFFCPVTGALSGDEVHISLPIGAGIVGTSGSPSAGFVVNGAYATTSDYIGVSISNLTGSATSTYAQATTSVQYFIIR